MRFHGTVVRGQQIGRKLGYPTANIVMDPVIDLPGGVYAAQVIYQNKRYDAMGYLSKKPYVSDTCRVLELNLFDFDGDLYDQFIELDLWDHIRPERKFPSSRELRRQIQKDKYAVQYALEVRKARLL